MTDSRTEFQFGSNTDPEIGKLREAYEKLDRMTNFDFGSNTQAYKLAMLHQSIADLYKEKSQYNADWKARMENLENQASALALAILSGQSDLFPAPDPPKEAA